MDLRDLVDLLVAARAVTPDDAAAYLDDVVIVGDTPVRAKLREHLGVHERAVCEVVAARLGAPVVVLSESTLDLTTLDLVPDDICVEFGVLPVSLDGDVLTLAGGRPDDAIAARRLAAVTGRSIVLVGALPELLDAAAATARLARAQGDRVWVGGESTSTEPCLTLARPPGAPAADAVARALGEILSEALAPTPWSTTSSSSSSSSTPAATTTTTPAPEDETAPRTPTTSRKLGALKLKQVARAPVVSGGASLPGEPAASEPRGVIELPSLPAGEGPRVVVVEDDLAIRTLLARVLTADGCVVEEAGDGRTALALMRRRRPDLVVLDAMLPEVHGFEICTAIKKSEYWAGIPVLMISAVFRGFENARQIQEIHGADVFVEKPFDLRHLRHVVANLLQRPRPDVPRAPVIAGEQARAEVAACAAVGDVEGAVQAARRWIDADPFDPDAWLVLGNAYTQRADGLLALDAFERAATYGRTLFAAQVALATTYESFGFVRRARATWLLAAGCAPDAETATKIHAALAAWPA